MAKKKRKKTERKRDLKYGSVTVPPVMLQNEEGKVAAASDKRIARSENMGFKKELRKNLLFVLGFIVALSVIYLVLTRTGLIDPLLSLFGLKGLYR